MGTPHLLLVLLSVFAREAFGQCTDDTTFQESCYVIPKAEANWIGAVRYCQTLKGNLASIDSIEEHTFVTGLITSNNTGHTLTFQTPPNVYEYQYLEKRGVSVHGHTSITFKVASCNDAHVALSATPDSHVDTYEIVIGGWADSQSVIRDCMQCAHMDEVRQQDHPLDCHVQRPFWLSWEDGHIRLGAGETVGEGQMLEWRDPDPHPVNHLGITTGWNSPGSWSFTVNTYQPGVFWLGATDLQVEGEWARLPDLDEASFTHWASGQPSGGEYRHCAAMDSARALLWIDGDCEVHRNFICELPAMEQ